MRNMPLFSLDTSPADFHLKGESEKVKWWKVKVIQAESGPTECISKGLMIL